MMCTVHDLHEDVFHSSYAALVRIYTDHKIFREHLEHTIVTPLFVPHTAPAALYVNRKPTIAVRHEIPKKSGAQ